MNIPYPPSDCTLAYIWGSELLVLPTGTDLGRKCVKCGSPASVYVPTVFHWPMWKPNFWGPWLAIGFLTYWAKRLLRLDQRVMVKIPLCRADRQRQIQRRWAGALLFLTGVALAPAAAQSFEARNSAEISMMVITVAALSAGAVIFFLGFHVLELIYYDQRMAAFKGFGIGYMEEVPSDSEVFSRTGVFAE